MKKYLILGGNGFIGRYITERLANNNKVIVADYNIEHTEEHENIQYKKLDFVNCEDFSEYLEDIDVVIHLISTIGPNEKTENINKEISENVFPTIRLLEDMVKCHTQKIVFISSGGTVYGEHNETPISEDEAKEPICNYGIIKELIEKYLKLYHLYYNLNYRIIRLANPYSEVVKKGKKQGIIPILIDQIIKGETVKIWGDGNDIRDYIYIEDAINAMIQVIEYEGEENVFNVGTGIGCSINDLLKLLQKEMNTSVTVSYVNARKCDVRNNVLDIGRIEHETGWQPEITLEQGIQKIISRKKENKSGD
ncbi:MAG TPA: NAD-dependent epimerase/dehydratase family protein [Candidatus Scybalousia intestinigallinarum]|nr:NAD-dependent epimerase/dehydratase family protein [Candidatus Scybalousia intestinigallinarum]